MKYFNRLLLKCFLKKEYFIEYPLSTGEIRVQAVKSAEECCYSRQFFHKKAHNRVVVNYTFYRLPFLFGEKRRVVYKMQHMLEYVETMYNINAIKRITERI